MLNSTSTKMLTKAFAILTVLLLISYTNIFSQTITPLTDIKTNDQDGLSVLAQDPSINVTGIVTSTIQPGTGTAGPGTIQDSQTGVAIYGNFFASGSGVKVGDSVIVTDVSVSPYNGLTELHYNANSAVQIISSGHIVEPVVVTIHDLSQGWNGFEKYESMYVQINSVTFADTATAFALISGKTYGRSYIVDGSDTVEFYFTKNCVSLLGKPVPKTSVNVVGIVSQYTTSSQANDGYELVALDSSAIRTITAVNTKKNKDFNYNLYQNYPNPFNPSTIINFELPSSQKVELSVYDLMGRKIATLYNSVAPAGVTSVNFKANNLASGVYIYSIKTNTTEISKKLILMK